MTSMRMAAAVIRAIATIDLYLVMTSLRRRVRVRRDHRSRKVVLRMLPTSAVCSQGHPRSASRVNLVAKHGRGLIGEGESKGYAAVSTSSDQDSVEGLATKDHVSIKTRDYPRKGRWKKVISSSDDRCQQDTTALYRCPNDKVGMPYRDRSGFFLVEMTACNPTLSGRRVNDRRSLLGGGRFTLSADSKAASSSKAAVGGLSSGLFEVKKKKQQMVWTPSGFVGSMVSDGLQMKVTRLPAGHEACRSSPIAVYKCQGDSRSTPFRNRRGRFMEHLDLTQGDLLCGEFSVFVFRAHFIVRLVFRSNFSVAITCKTLLSIESSRMLNSHQPNPSRFYPTFCFLLCSGYSGPMTAYPFMDQSTQLFHIEKAMRRSKKSSFRSDRLQNRWLRPKTCRNPLVEAIDSK